MKWFARQSRLFFIAASVLTVAAVGIVDYATRWELSFSVFYLVALVLAAWFVGRGFAYFISVCSVMVSVAGDMLSDWRYSSLLVPFWNASMVLAFYLILTSLLTRLRELTKGLEAQVHQRTGELTEQIAERERLERELLEVSEREQRRIGHDLHDSLGQQLTGAALAGQVLEQKLSARNLPEAADAAKVVGLVQDGIALSRKLAKGLHPIELEAAGLMQALEELAAATRELFGVNCRFECDSPVLINDVTASGHLYRIAQEAVSNAIRHGKARNILVILETTEAGSVLHIKDDGLGLPATPHKNAGMGLRIMAHRASIIGATFEARRDDSVGTVVSCVLRHRELPEHHPREQG